MAVQERHTILLIQTGKAPSTRRYEDHAGIGLAMDAICQRFEQKLRAQHQEALRAAAAAGTPAAAPAEDISYDVSQLYDFIDSLEDLGALVFDPSTAQYAPHNKEWVKETVFAHLKQAAEGQQ